MPSHIAQKSPLIALLRSKHETFNVEPTFKGNVSCLLLIVSNHFTQEKNIIMMIKEIVHE